MAQLQSTETRQHKRPLGYVRVKIFNRSILAKALVDSGNLFADLISEELAKLLRLKIYGQPRTVGTAANAGTVTVLGRTKPFYLFLEGINQPVQIRPYVVQDLAHPINLGQAFLRDHKADMTFREDGIQLRLKGKVTVLTHSGTPLSTPSIDARIKGLLDKWKNAGQNPVSFDSILDLRLHNVNADEKEPFLPGLHYGDCKRPIQFSGTRTNAYTVAKTKLKPGCTTVVNIKYQHQARSYSNDENTVFLFPRKDSSFLNNKLLFVHPGTYTRGGETTRVLISNLSDKEVQLPDRMKLGQLSEATAYADAINELDHRPPEELTEEDLQERRRYIVEQLKLDDNPNLKDPKRREKVIEMFLDNWAAVSVSEYDYGKTNLLKFHIQVPAGTPPIRAKARPLNPEQEAQLKKQIDAWKEAKIIEESLSPWASALVPCVKKGTDKLRFAIDFRALNKVTVKDAYPLANIETNLHKLSGASVYSTLDSCGAFHNMEVDPASRDYTTFVSCFGSYRFNRVPFGVCNGPSSYSRLVALVLSKLPGSFSLAYIDDVVVYSKTTDEHLEHLRQVVKLHATYGMKLNLGKCQIVRNQVEYLGHLVSNKGIEMIDSYVEKILDWPLPEDPKQLKSWIGFTGYYRSFIKDYSKLTNRMNDMKKDKVLVWTKEAVQDFEDLKAAFKTRPLRSFPRYDIDSPFILDTDYSSTNMAAVLSQVQDGKEAFIGCCAKKCNKAQRSYPSHKGELGAVILGLRKFEHILRARPFVIRTDSKCVEFLQSMKECRGMYARWQAFLSSFNFTTVHRSGTLQANADPLSRRPGIEESPEDDELLDPEGHLNDVADIYQIAPEEPGNHREKVKEISKKDFAKATQDDPILKVMCKYVTSGHKPDREERKGLLAKGMHYVNNFESLSVEEGILYFQAPTTNGVEKPKRICVPLKLQAMTFQLAHAHPMGGHYGQQNTYDKMKDRFYFPGMYSYTVAMTNNCVPCIAKRSTLPKPTHNQHREELSYFSQRVYIDTVGPLTPVRHNGQMCRHFITIEDGYTRYLVAVPVPTIDASTLAEAIVEKWCMVYGCPEVIHTDRGSAFQSKLFQEVMDRLGIVKTCTPIYSPQANRVERVHRVLGDIIRADRRYDANAWPLKLLAGVMAYNTTRNRIIGISPYEAVFSRKAILPIDLAFPFNRQEGRSWSNYFANLQMKFHEMSQKICLAQQENLDIEQQKYQARSPLQFKVGDFVYYFLGRIKPGLSKKLQSRWIGPWKIIRVVSESLVVIYPEGTWSERPRELAAIVNRLRKVDPKLSMSDLRPTRRKRIDLMEILDDLEEMNEVLSYQGPEEAPRDPAREAFQNLRQHQPVDTDVDETEDHRPADEDPVPEEGAMRDHIRIKPEPASPFKLPSRPTNDIPQDTTGNGDESEGEEEEDQGPEQVEQPEQSHPVREAIQKLRGNRMSKEMAKEKIQKQMTQGMRGRRKK